MELGKKIRVLVVDDSALARNLIIQGLSAHPRMEVVGYAINTLDAKQKIPRLKPDVVTMDVEMPGQSGIDFLKEYLPANPVPVILCSSLNLKVFDALNAGAVDFVRKPDVQESKEVFITNLTQKVLVASMSKPRSTPLRSPSVAVATPNLGGGPALDRVLVGLGASTGGTEATLEVMRRLPADIPPMVIVQHMPKGFTQMYADRLNRICKMEVREARNGDELHRGLALVAPADLQCRVVRIGEKYTVSCTPGEKVSGHRPSVDAMFHSMAEVVRCKMVGTIGQDKESSVVYGMPMVANDIGAVCVQASCDNVANVLLRHLKTLH